MDSNFLSYIKEHLLPLFSGAVLINESDPKPKSSNSSVTRMSPTKIALLLNKNDTTRVLIGRSQPFSRDDFRLINYFIDELSHISNSNLNQAYNDKLTDIALKISIARYLNDKEYILISKIIDIFEKLAGKTYEGNNLSIGLGLTGSSRKGEISIDDFYDNDFGLVLSNGIDTIVKTNYSGFIIGHESLDDSQNNSYAPITYVPIANWSDNDNISFVLNRNGEILIFASKKLLFTKRRRKWQFYSHEILITRIGAKNNLSWNESLRNAVYESSLDISFARTGGLLSLIKEVHEKSVFRLIHEEDRPGTGTSKKSKYIRSTISESFAAMPRRIRLELLTIDGATILDHNGKIINIGSIVTKIDPTDEGGARTAAARSLSEFGISLKISMDGQVFGYTKKGKDKPVEKYISYC